MISQLTTKKTRARSTGKSAAFPVSFASLGLLPPADERFEHITRLAYEIFGVPIARVALAGDGGPWFRTAGAAGASGGGSPGAPAFCDRAMRLGEPLVIDDALDHPDFANDPLVIGEPFVRFFAGQPIIFEGLPIGVLCLVDKVPRQLLPEQRAILASLGRWVENELMIAALSEAQSTLLAQLEEARRESYIDPLTRIWNRRGADRLLLEEVERARRKGEQVALLMIDVDRFKEINDQHGHQAGDQALMATAHRLRTTMRPYDMIARFGGDEMLVFAGNCPARMAETLAMRIFSRIACEPVIWGDCEFYVTLSIGIYVGPVMDVETMLGRADAALYAAKAAGRSCIRFAGPA